MSSMSDKYGACLSSGKPSGSGLLEVCFRLLIRNISPRGGGGGRDKRQETFLQQPSPWNCPAHVSDGAISREGALRQGKQGMCTYAIPRQT